MDDELAGISRRTTRIRWSPKRATGSGLVNFPRLDAFPGLSFRIYLFILLGTFISAQIRTVSAQFQPTSEKPLPGFASPARSGNSVWVTVVCSLVFGVAMVFLLWVWCGRRWMERRVGLKDFEGRKLPKASDIIEFGDETHRFEEKSRQ